MRDPEDRLKSIRRHCGTLDQKEDSDLEERRIAFNKEAVKVTDSWIGKRVELVGWQRTGEVVGTFVYKDSEILVVQLDREYRGYIGTCDLEVEKDIVLHKMYVSHVVVDPLQVQGI